MAARRVRRHRAARPRSQIPASAADAADRRKEQQAALDTRIRKIDTAQASKILELEQIPADPGDTASAALRARIRARFAELHHEREQLEAQLKKLAKTTPEAADTTLLDQLPLAEDVLPRLPPALKARLFTVFDMSVLWNKIASQATVRAVITENTLKAAAALLDPSQDGFHDTHPASTDDDPTPMWDLPHLNRCRREPHSRI